MPKIRVTKEFGFETAHVLDNYDGKCKNIHGHSYKLYVTILGETISDPSNIKNGMVMDFGDLKKIVNNLIIDNFDHALVINKSHYEKIGPIDNSVIERLFLTDYQPTCENMVYHFSKIIKPALPNNIKLKKIKLYETATSYAEWCEEDN